MGGGALCLLGPATTHGIRPITPSKQRRINRQEPKMGLSGRGLTFLLLVGHRAELL
jgi:hypothetical protein